MPANNLKKTDVEGESSRSTLSSADMNHCISQFFQEKQTQNQSINLASPTKSDSSHDLSQNSISDEISLTQLSIQEQEPLKINPFYNITPRKMPISPHYIFEEEFSANPWAMLIATIFLTKTSGKTARRYIREFFDEYPTPYHVLNDTPTSLERFFENLGLKKRGSMIWRLTYQFVSSKWRRASDLCGIGKYGEDAYRIFCLGHTDLEPDDRYLRLYFDWLRNTDFINENGVIDSEFLIDDPVLKYYSIGLKNAVEKT